MIVEATAVMTTHSTLDHAEHARNRRIQAAMIAAIEQCAAKGIVDPAAIRKAQLDARDAFLAAE